MNTEEIKAEYREHMGSDLSVVNAARASFGKESEWLPSGAPADYPGVVYQQRFVEGRMRPVNLSQADASLIRFLATGFRAQEWDDLLNEIIETVISNAGSTAGVVAMKGELTDILHAYKRKPQHWAPFAHPHCTIRVQMPIFLARQFVKHQIGGVWSEESRRYISDEPGVWFPDEWHTRPEDIKQGSGGLVGDQVVAQNNAVGATTHSLKAYDNALQLGVAPEEARITLPLNMMTTVVWTGSLLFWARVCNQRVDSHAQLAAQELGKKISSIMQPLYPVSWKELTGL